jgi:hypothetical protein
MSSVLRASLCGFEGPWVPLSGLELDAPTHFPIFPLPTLGLLVLYFTLGRLFAMRQRPLGLLDHPDLKPGALSTAKRTADGRGDGPMFGDEAVPALNAAACL